MIKIYGPFTVHILSLFVMSSQAQIAPLSFMVVNLKKKIGADLWLCACAYNSRLPEYACAKLRK